MWKIWYFVALFLLLLLVIDESPCEATRLPSIGGRRRSTTTTLARRLPTVKPIRRTTRRKVIKQLTTQKVHSLNSLCHILNYGEFTHAGLTTHTINIANEPIKKYQTGYRNRVEYVHAVITPQTVASGGSTTNGAARKYARSMGKSTDDAGHIIGNQLGGTGRDLYNISPQSPNINRGAWSKEEKAIRNLVQKTNQPIEVVVQLYYPATTATRPERFFYRASYNNACHSASVINP